MRPKPLSAPGFQWAAVWRGVRTLDGDERDGRDRPVGDRPGGLVGGAQCHAEDWGGSGHVEQWVHGDQRDAGADDDELRTRGSRGRPTESVNLTGQSTHWVQGTSVASFGAGITVASLTVNSATSATAVLNIDAAAAAGARNVTVTTGGEAVTLTNGFTVTNGTPVLTTVNSEHGAAGADATNR